MTITEIDEKFMREALAEARAAAAVGEVPIGAVVVCAGEIVARAHNRRELDRDPSAHAEFAALCAAAQTLGRWRLSDCTVYVTLEPCCMCAGLMVNARVGRCVYAAADAKAGALGSLYDLNADSRLNHRFNVMAGVLADECRAVLSSYFAGLRGVDGCGCGSDLEAHAAHAAALADADEVASAAVDFGPVRRRPRRVLLAIDSFKGSVSSTQAESAVAEGVRCVWPDAEVSTLPLADGGEGTLDAVAACGGELLACEVAGPLGGRVSARMLVDGERESAVIEMAEAAGIGYSPCTESAALAATTYGVGELMLRAVRAGVKTIYIGLGGSATNDGGAGMLQALGARVVDDQGCDIAPGLRALSKWPVFIWCRRCGRWMACASSCFPMSRIRLWDVVARWRCSAGKRACRRVTPRRCISTTAGWSAMVACLIRRLPRLERGSCCVCPRVRGHLARYSACRARALPVGWGPPCWHLVPSCARAWRRYSTLWDLTSACAMWTWS